MSTRLIPMETEMLDWSAHDNCDHVPNAETIAAIRESNEHLRQLEAGEIQSRFSNAADFLVSLLSDEEFEA